MRSLHHNAMSDHYLTGPTDASIRAARAACTAERQRFGLNPDPDAPAFQGSVVHLLASLPPAERTLRHVPFPLPANELPVDERSALAVQLQALVEGYGLPAVRLALAHIDAATQEAR